MVNTRSSNSKQPSSAPPPESQSDYPSPRQTSEELSASPPPNHPLPHARSTSELSPACGSSELDRVPDSPLNRASTSARSPPPPPATIRALRPAPTPLTQTATPPATSTADPHPLNKRRRRSNSANTPATATDPPPTDTRAAARRAHQNRVKRDRRRAIADALKAALKSGRINAHTVTQGTIDSVSPRHPSVRWVRREPDAGGLWRVQITVGATRKWDRVEERKWEREERKKGERRRKAQAEYVRRNEAEATRSVMELGDSEEEIDLLDEDD